MATDLDYLAHIASDSARFLAVLRDVPAAARVPTCPDWNADDLLWHLAEVQWFWGTIVRLDVDAARAEQLKPERPADRAGLLDFYQRATDDLAAALSEAAPDAYRWTWADDKSVGFVRRRQAQEALIHRVDAELTAGDRGPMDPRLSADGVDEALRIMFGGDVPDWGTFTPGSAKALRLRTTDTGDSWLVTVGRFTGTDPDDQTSYDEPILQVAATDAGEAAATTISGMAADLDCWLWQRPPLGHIDRSGEEDLLTGFQSVIAQGIN